MTPKMRFFPSSAPVILLAAAAAFALGCGGPAGAPSGSKEGAKAHAPVAPATAAKAPPEVAARVGQLAIEAPRARLTPGTPAMGAVYLRVVNAGETADRLAAVETPAARSAETHESVDDGGVMRMVAHPDGFEVPAGGVLELAPGGKHIMLVEPQPTFEGTGGAEGAGGKATIPLTLRFERAGSIEIDVPIEGPMEGMGKGAMGGGGHEHGGSR